MIALDGVKLLLLSFCFFIVDADINVSAVKCGTKICKEYEYCERYATSCEPCENICETTNHNFDENRCQQDCQNYLLTRNNNSLRDEVRNLRYIASTSLTLTCILLAIMIIVGAVKILNLKKKHNVNLSWLQKKMKSKEKSKPDRSTVSVTIASGKPDLRLDMPAVGLQTPSVNGNTPSTATTTFSRHPTEDNTLDYAYDNPVMVSTPSPAAKPHESSL